MTGNADDSQPTFHVTHMPQQSQFVALDDTGRLGALHYTLSDGVIDLQHTIVEPSAGGRGVGSALVLAALDYARAHGLQVIPTCSFVPAIIGKHPGYADLLG